MRRGWKVLLVFLAVLTLLAADIAAAERDPAFSFRSDFRTESKGKNPTATPGRVTKTPAPGPDARMTPTPVPDGPIIDPQSIADYIFAHGCLPDNFMTKKEAQALGFDNYRVFLSDVAPGMSIGGDWFGNYEKLLPVEKGVVYHEADCYYTKGKRDKYRIVYSSNGRVWYSEDHYNSFTELFPTAADAPEEQEGMKVPEAPEEPEEPETTPFSLWDWLWG